MAKKNKKKVPSAAVNPPVTAGHKWKKEPRFEASESVNGKQPLSWRFSACDKGGPYSWDSLTQEELFALMQRLPEFEKMTWDELHAAGCHPIDKENLCSEAQQRLIALDHDDIDELMSFRVTGPKRLWCVRDGSLMRVLWWDASHQVYPTVVDRADRIKQRRRAR